MPETVGRRVKNIISSGSLKKWQKAPDAQDDPLTEEEVDAAAKDLDDFINSPTKASEDEWAALEQNQQRMTGS
jgi:hypothetical protein